VRWRPAILFTATYGAGLLTGLMHFGAPFGAAAVTLGAAFVTRAPQVSFLAAAGLLGRLSGELATVREGHRCAALLPAARLRLTLRLLEPVDSTGGRITVQPIDARCHSGIIARWPSGQPLRSGMTVAVSGRWIPRALNAGRRSGTLVVSGVEQASGRPSWSDRLRTGVASASRDLFGVRAPMVDALILGRRAGIDRDLQDRFAQSGLVHLLSISGFHVGVITGWVFLLGRAFRLHRELALGLAAGASLVYVAFLGWPAPATRAAALATLLALSRARQRHVEPDGLLSATCLCVLLVDPWAVLDLGAWLSAAALWGATTFTRWTDRTLGTAARWRTLGSSVGATLTTAPITAAALGSVAMIGIVLNFVAIPAAAVAVPGVLASLVFFPILPGVAESLAGGAGLALHLLELLATFGAAVPYGHAVGAAELRFAWPWAAALMVSLWCIGRRNTLIVALRRWSWAAVVALWVGLFWGWVPASSDTTSGLALHFLDVGQGDGAVLRTPAGRWVVIDAGPIRDHDDAGRRVLVPFLVRHRAREVAMLVLSHAHADHLGGVSSVLHRYPVAVVLDPGARVAEPLYYGFLDELAAEAVPWHAGRRGEQVELDGVRFTILHPDPSWSGWGQDVNEDSLVLLVEYGAFQALFAGDAGFPAEAEMRGRARAVDVLKIGHHGSRGSTGDEWLDSLRPSVAVISVGRNNYGHPSAQTLSRLRRHRVHVWRTDRDGTVTIITDGQRMRVRSGDRDAVFDVR
jgi:competence protein ComEC